MSTRDVHRSGSAGATSSEHAPLWAIGLSTSADRIRICPAAVWGCAPRDRRSQAA